MSTGRGGRVLAETAMFVSRGGTKLAAALDALRVPVEGRLALDAGASTGGFTDCLLERGARKVIAVDVAYGILAWKLRTDPRVEVLERTNVRHVTPETIGEPVELVVADLAFISLVTVRDALVGACLEGADLLLLVKPQFEVPRRDVERGGVVRDPSLWMSAVSRVVQAYRSAGCGLAGACPSPLVGRAGNREFFVHLAKGGADGPDKLLCRAVEQAP